MSVCSTYLHAVLGKGRRVGMEGAKLKVQDNPSLQSPTRKHAHTAALPAAESDHTRPVKTGPSATLATPVKQ